MQLLYAHDAFPLTDFETHWSGIRSMLELDEGRHRFAKELATGTIQHLFEINELLVKFLQNWALSRVEKVCLAILRIAVYELLYRTDIPAAVTINEAVELAKLYGGEDSKRLINGVLDKIQRNLVSESKEFQFNRSGGDGATIQPTPPGPMPLDRH
jgi:N utilization substance protein B